MNIWRDFKVVKNGCTIECPITGGMVDLESYEALYGPTLNTIEYMDEYFELTHVGGIHWVFRSREVQAEFVKMCQEDGCMEEWKIIKEGWENKKCKEDHRKQEKHRKVLSDAEKSAKVLASLDSSILKARDLLNCGKGDRTKLERMLQRREELV